MANGTIAFDTLSTSGQISGTAKSVDSDYLAYGSAKHFSVIKGTDTFGTINSFNQSGATDHGTGEHSVTHTTNFSDADGSPPMALTHNTGDGGSNVAEGLNRGGTSCYLKGDQAPQTTAIRLSVSKGADADADGGAIDLSFVYIIRHGDLA